MGTTTGTLQNGHQPKDENTLMLHITIMMAISFSMKYLESSCATCDGLRSEETYVQAYLWCSKGDGTKARCGPT